MNADRLQSLIEAAWDDRDRVGPDAAGDVHDAVDAALDGLDSGRYRVAEPRDGGWHVSQWLKKAVLLSFRLNDMTPIPGGPGPDTNWWDKVPSKFAGWGFFLMAGQVLRFQVRIASSLRSRALPTGRCGLQWSARRIFQTWPLW